MPKSIYQSKIKHIENKHHQIRDIMKKNKIKLRYRESEENIVNIFIMF